MSTPDPRVAPAVPLACMPATLFQPAPLPTDEGERLVALRRLGMLDTAPQESFDAVTQLSAQALKVPIVLVSLVDANRQWFKSKVGLEASQTGRDVSFCAHAVYERRPLVVCDATQDTRFALNPLVTGAPHIRAYMGVPLYTRDGQPVGTLCAIDRQPRDFGPAQLATLRAFARIIEEFFHARELALHTSQVLKYAAEREALFRETFEQAAVGIVHTSLTGHLIRINQRFCSMLGYSTAELTAQTFLDITHPEDLAESTTLFQRLIAGEVDSYRLEKRFMLKDGGTLWAHLSVALKREPSGRPEYIITVVEDISEKKRIEADLVYARDSLQRQVDLQTQKLKSSNDALHVQVRQALQNARALRKAESRLRAIVDHVPACIGYWNADLRCEAANQAYREAYAVAPDALIGMHISAFLGEKLFKLAEPYMRLALGGKAQRFERVIVRERGRRAYFDTQYVPDLDEGGAVHGFFVLQTDVTDLRVAQMALEATNAKLHNETVTDYLTGLSNRRIFTERAELAARNFRDCGALYGLILLDLDNFKVINDQFGHDNGDEVLRIVGKVLRKCLRGSADDVVARLGGEEFAVLCCGGLDADGLRRVAERIRLALCSEVVKTTKGMLRFTASLGLALSNAQDEDWKIIYARADAALYEAKEGGKNCARFSNSYDKGATGRLRALIVMPNG